MTLEQKQPYFDEADKIKNQHKRDYPGMAVISMGEQRLLIHHHPQIGLTSRNQNAIVLKRAENLPITKLQETLKEFP